MPLEIGSKFPHFNLHNQDGKTVKSEDFAGKWLVVYVYPKDDTPGCTIQGKSFTATKHQFNDAGVEVIGVSEDDVLSHKNFCNKYSLNIDLLSDTEHDLLQAAGVGRSEYKGQLYWDRTTFVIDPNGDLKKIYMKVDPQGHEQVLLNDIKELQGQAKTQAQA